MSTSTSTAAQDGAPAAQKPEVSPLERQLDITVAKKEVEQATRQRLQRMGKTIRMPGFRPGKVPLKIIEQNYGHQAWSEAINEALQKALDERLRAEDIRIAGQPRIEPKASTEETRDENADLVFNAIFEIYPEVTLSDIAEQTFSRPRLEVGEAEIDKTIDVLRRQRTTYEDADRLSQEGDRVTVDFLGTLDNKPFEGGQADGFVFVIGSGAMLPEFDDAARNMKSGEQKEFDLVFPDDYHAKQLAGKNVQFAVTMKRIEAPVLPEIDETFARTLGIADGDTAKLRAEVQNNLEREVKRRLQERLKEQVMDTLISTATLEVPRSLVAAEAEQLAQNALQDMETRGMKTKDMPIEASWFAEQAERRVKLGLILAEVVKANELYAKPEQVKTLLEDMAQSYEDPQELIRWYYADPKRLSQIEALAIENNVIDWATGQAKTTEEDISFDELMGHAAAQP